jgi:drug/metabolite transporter (DMT)-like permease
MGSLVSRVGSTISSFITYILGVVFRNDRVKAISRAGVVLVIGGALLADRGGPSGTSPAEAVNLRRRCSPWPAERRAATG